MFLLASGRNNLQLQKTRTLDTDDNKWEKGGNRLKRGKLEIRRCKMGEKVKWRENGWLDKGGNRGKRKNM